MEKIKLIALTFLIFLIIITSALYLISYYFEYQYQFNRKQENKKFNEQISFSSKSPYEIIDIGGGGHSDGGEEVGIWPFIRYHHTAAYSYTGKLKVIHNNQVALINVDYYFLQREKEILDKKRKEGILVDPYNLTIGIRTIKKYDDNGKEKYEVVKGTGQDELDKILSIGLSKEEFENNLKKHFTDIHYY